EVEDRYLFDVRIVHAWRADIIALMVHVVDEPADVLGDKVALQRPRRVCIADGKGEIGYVAEHHAFIDQRLWHHDRRAVHDELHAAEEFQNETGGGHDDVRVEVFTGFE